MERKITMALINCPECGNRISDKCRACPSCGYPMDIDGDAPPSEKPTARVSGEVEPIISSEEIAQRVGAGSSAEEIPPAPQPVPQPTPQPAPQYIPKINWKPDLSKLSGAGAKIRSAAAAIPVKNLVLFLACVCAAVIAAKVCIRFLLTPYLSGVNDYIKAVNAEDVEDMGAKYAVAALREDKDIDEYLDDNADSIEESEEWVLDYYEEKYGDDIKYSYDFVSAVPMTDTAVGQLESAINSDREEDVKISKGVTATVEVTLKSDEREKNETVRLDLIKVDGEWLVSGVSGKNGDYSKLLGIASIAALSSGNGGW